MSADVEVVARVDGAPSSSTSLVYGPFGFWFYSLDLPVDDPATAVGEGGTDGESVTFEVGGATVSASAVFQADTYQRLDLVVPKAADLELQIDDQLDVLAAGETATWTLTVSNAGEGPADGIELWVDLPPGLGFVGADGGASELDGRVSWPVFDLAEGQSAERSVTLEVAATLGADQVSAELVARVVDDGSRGLDPDPADNVARDFDRLVASPDLVVVIDDGLESIAPGEMVDFTVSVENLGTRDGSRVSVSVALDPAVLFQTADFDGGELQEGVVSWPLLDLAVGETIQRTFRVLVPMDLGVGIARLEHRASAQPGNGPDGDADTNTNIDWTDVEQYAGLRPSLLDTTSMIQDAQTLEVSGSVLVTIQNDGNLDLADSFTVAIFDDADGDGVFDEGVDPVLGTTIVDDFLAAGDSMAASIDLAGFVSFVDQPLWAMVDSSRVIPELDEDDNTLSTAFDCVAPPPVRQFDPVVEMSWPADDTNLEEPNAKESMSTPIVVQLTDDNGDGRRDELDDPDIVFVAADLVDVLNPRLRLRAIDGATGRSHWAVLPPISDYLTFSLSGLAAGDLDGDGDTEIVVSTPSPPLGALSGHSNHLTAYDHRGRQLWSTRWYQTHPTGSTFTNRDHPTLADLDGNGKSEVIVGGNVFSHSGALKWRGSAGQGYQSARNANRSDSGAISTVVDLDMDGTPEILAGNTAYRSDGTIYWQSPLGDGYTAVGNFDDDDFPEAVVVSRGTVRLHEHDGAVIWGPVDLPGVEPNAGGAPTVADFDADGEPEIGVAGSDFYTVFETDGSVKWQRAVRDASSNQTGSTVFDFDADGRFEVVYRDEAYLYIFTGDTGEVLFRDALSSFTANEQPVVVDVDRDGQAEILVTSDLAINLSGLPRRTTGLRVYGDRNGTWVGARSVWNQHAYSIDNVDDDGGIPRNAAYGWLTHNTFRANVSPVAGPAAAPDLTVSTLRLDRGTLPEATITVRVGNGGAVRAPAGAPVAFYADGALLGVTSTTVDLAPGSYEDVQIQATLPVFGSVELSAVVGDDGTGPQALWDCRASNNRHAQVFDFAELGLWTTLYDGRTTVQVGETVTYTVSFGNAGAVARSGVSVSAYLPEHAVEPSADGGATISTSISGDEIQWPSLSLAPGELRTFSFSYRVDPSLPLDVAQLSTRAWVRDDGTVPDPTPWDRSVVDVNRVSSVRADAGGPYSGLEGVPVTFDGSASTDRNGTVVAWAWDFDGDGSFDDGSGPVASHTFLDDGEFTVWVRVTDDSGESATTAVQVELSNQDPIAQAGAPLSSAEGDGVTLTGASFTDPGSLDTHTVQVDWGDGQSSDGVVESGGELRAGHFYVDDGVYTVQVCVRDDDGGIGCDTTSVTVSNVAPEVLDDGAVDLATWLPQHLSTDPSDQGSWEVSEDGTSVLQTQNVGPTVLLSPFAASGVTLEGEVRPGSSNDDDFFGFVIGFEPDDFTNPEADYLVFDWKKGVQYSENLGLARVGTAMSRVHGIPRVSELWSHEARPMQPSDAFDELAKGLEKGSEGWSYGTTYRFRIQVESMRLRLWIDDQLELDLSGDFDFGDGRFGFYNFSQENVRYRAFTAIGEGIVEGDEVALALKFVDPGSDDVHTADVDWADGSVTELDVEATSYGGIVSGTHVYPDDGVFEAQACVDDGTDRGCGTVPFTVLNLAPSFEAGPHRAANSASPVVLDIPFTDPGVLDSHEAEIEWGDGTFERLSYPAGGSRIQASKSYESDGIYPVEICLVDNGGARRCDGFEVLWGDPFVDLAARVWSLEPAVRQGGMVTVVVEAENLGSATVTGIELVYELPTELTFVEASGGGVYDPSTQRVVWAVPSLGFREKATFTVKVQAPDSSPPGGSVELVGRAAASHDGSAGIDVDVSNDSAEHTILWLDEQTPYPVIDGVDDGLEVDEGHTLRLTATIDDPDHVPDPDPGSSGHTVTVDWGDGATGTLVPTLVQGVEQIVATHRYVDDGIYTLRLCVSDGTHEGCQSLPVRVHNLAPDLLEADENVDLRLWQTQDLEIGSQNPANWIPTDDGSHVYQTVNARASVFVSDFPAFGTRLATQMWVGPRPEFDSQTDDDYLGLVLGWSPGDAFEADGDFLLISWKQKDDEGAKKGLWVSRITGRPSNLWRLEEASSGVEVLAKGRTLAHEGWEWWKLYDWRVQYDAHQLKVWVDGSLEFDLYNPEGDFPAGSFGFYNYSQDRVMYRGVGRTGFGGVEGSPTAVRPLFVDGGELDTHWASVRWGDGEGPDTVPVSKTGTVSTVLGEHVYAEDGSYVSRVCAVDDDGGRGCGLVEVEIRNAPPVIDPGPSADVPFGVEFSLTDVVLTDPGILDTHQVSIDWGDGSSGSADVVPVEISGAEVPGTFTVQAVHTYTSDLGDYSVTICAIDDEGAEGCGIKTLTVVGSTEPQELNGQIGPGAEGGLVQLTGTFLDPDAGDTHTSTIDWGDGSPVEPVAVSSSTSGGTAVAEHTYVDDGVYTARWCVTDSASQSSCLDVPAIVENLAPIRGQEGGEAGSPDGFRRWQREDLNGAGDWLISDEGRRVRQRSNANGTFFYGYTPVLGARSHVTARMWNDDDDTIGLALGFEPGDLTNPDADYLMVLWKKTTQSGAPAGLKIARIRGTQRNFWTQSGADFELLGQGAIHGERGWRLNADYRFSFELTAERLRLWVNDRLEADLEAPADDPFSDGRFALFTYAQEYVVYRDFEQQALPEDGGAASGRATHFWAGADLSQWQAEGFFNGDTPADWTLVNDAEFVRVTTNSRPSALLSPEDHLWRRLRFVARPFEDNDYFGLVIGYNPGDAFNPDADYLLMVWKRVSEDGSLKGLKLYRISGRPASFWDLTGTEGVTLVASAETLGSTGWDFGRNDYYEFEIDPKPDQLRIWVNGRLQFDVATPVPAGRYGLYVYRQDAMRFIGTRLESAGVFYEGDTVDPLGAGFTDRGRLDTHVGTVVWNDGSDPMPTEVAQLRGLGSVLLPEHVFLDDLGFAGPTVCATDDDGGEDCRELPLRVLNVAPTAEAGATLEGVVDAPIQLQGTYSDPGVLDTHTYTVNWGDGSEPSTGTADGGIVDPTHVYAAEGVYAVELCLTDDDGGQGCDATTVEVSGSRPVGLSIDDVTVLEGDPVDGSPSSTSAVLTLTLEEPSSQTIEGTFETSADPAAANPATAEVDYRSASGSWTIEAGELSTELTVEIVGDGVDELNERFSVRIHSASPRVILVDDTGTVEILDDDEALLSIRDASVVEGDDGPTPVEVEIRLSVPSDREVRVTVYTEDLQGEAVSGVDYEPTTTELVFPPGSTESTVEITVLGDRLLEADERFAVRLEAAVNAQIEDGEALVTILDDEPCPSPNLLQNGDAESPMPRSATEPPGWMLVRGEVWIELASPLSGNASLAIRALADGEGEATGAVVQELDLAPWIDRIDGGELELNLAGSVRLDGPGTAAVEAAFFDAAGVELDRWSVETSDPGGPWTLAVDGIAPVGSRWLEIWLTVAATESPEPAVAVFDSLELRSLGVATLRIGDAAVYESDSVDAVLPVTLSCELESTVMVTASTADGTAVTPEDYGSVSVDLTFDQGHTESEVSVPIIADGVAEPLERFFVELRDLTAAVPVVVLDDSGTVTIVDGRPCARSPGYWKTHPEAWPVSWLELGSVVYGVPELQEILEYGGPDAATKLARALIATRLNLLSGASPWMAESADASDVFLSVYPPGSNPRGQAKQEATALKNELESAYETASCEGE